jgi:integrase
MSLYNNHIKKVFENRYINTIKPGEIEKFLINLTKPTKDKKRGEDIKYSQEYILGFYKTFCAVFKYAWKHEYVSVNIMERIDCNGVWFSKAKEKEEGRFLSAKELSVIDNTLKGSNLYPSFKIALHSGLRISEIFALTWNDIDFEKNLIRVSKQIQYDDKRKIWCLVSPKTQNSNRVVPMPDELVVFLKELRNKQLQDKAELGEFYRDKDKLTGFYDKNGRFCKGKGFDFVNKKSTGERLTPDSTKYATRRVEATTGKHRFLLDPNDPTSDIDFSYHDFRHTYATLCALNGVAIEDLQDMLGHSKITTTKKFYLHKDSENNPQRDKCINEIFSSLNRDISEMEKVNVTKAEETSDDNKLKEVIYDVSDLPEGEFRNGIYIEK